jgi:uncharacterized protein (DUF4415 family)
MKKEYDLKKMKVRHRGPVVDAKRAKVMISLRVDGDILNWLVKLADEKRVPYQTLINSFLKEAMDRDGVDAEANMEALIEQLLDKREKAG